MRIAWQAVASFGLVLATLHECIVTRSEFRFLEQIVSVFQERIGNVLCSQFQEGAQKGPRTGCIIVVVWSKVQRPSSMQS